MSSVIISPIKESKSYSGFQLSSFLALLESPNNNYVDYYIRNFGFKNYLNKAGRTVYLHMSVRDLTLTMFDIKKNEIIDEIRIAPEEFTWKQSNTLSNLTSYVDSITGEIWF